MYIFVFAVDLIWLEVEILIIKDEVSLAYRNYIDLIIIVASIFSILVRACEPYVWNTFKSMFGCKKQSELKFKSLSLNSFINSAMNIEFVCLILNGVSNFMFEIQETGMYAEFQDIDGIQLEDVEAWQVMSNDVSRDSTIVSSNRTTN